MAYGDTVGGDGEKDFKEGGNMPWWAPGWGGRGWRWWYRATGLPGWMIWRYYGPYFEPEDELKMLEAMKADLEAELEEIKRRIEELKKKLGE